MDVYDYIFWGVLTMIGLAGSALYSGLETGSYTINRVRLHVRAHAGDRRAIALTRLVESPSVILGVLLIGNNLANYMGTASLTVIIESFDLELWEVVLLNTLLITPLLLVFGEILPKDMFSAFADRLMYPLVWFLRLSHHVFFWTGMLPFVQAISELAMWVCGSKKTVMVLHPRRRMGVLVRESVAYGVISDEQSAIAERILELSDEHVGSQMTPWREVIRIKDTDTTAAVWALAERSSRSHLPVVGARGAVLGHVNVLDVLLQGPCQDLPLTGFMRSIIRVDIDTPLRSALRRLQDERQSIALVMQGTTPVGVVTVKDLIEPITGELATW